MKIGIIGSGSVGGTLGTRWAAGGHEVVFGSRRPEFAEMQALVAKSPGSRTVSAAETAAASDAVLIATPWEAAREAIESAGSLAGKIVIDATNPLLPQLAGLSVGTTSSAAELIAEWAPGAHVVKAFNTIGNNIMDNPRFGERGAVLFYCGDDAEAKRTVHQLAAELGFDPHDAGPLRQARLLEPFALLWISLAYAQGYGREMGFELLRR